MSQPTGGEALRIYEKTLACVHCGLCLPACPAYENAPRESLAPRGQVFNARAMLEGRLPASAGLAEDLYECLACRGCETVCPAGVEVGAIVEGVRGLVAEERVESLRARVLKRFALGLVVARPAVLNAAMWLLRVTGRLGLRRLEVVAPHLRPETSRAAIEALVANGWEVVIPREQGCCGALHLHAGLPDLARGLAHRNLAAFPDDLPVVTTAAGCGAALSEYEELLDGGSHREAAPQAGAFSRRVTDVSAFLAESGCRPPAAGPRETPLRVVYDAPCHLFHAQQVREEPLRILRSLPGVEVVTVRDPERCCGSAGIYNVTRHDTSMAVLDRKMANIAPARPDLIATGNIGCQLQLAEGARRAGLAAEVAHPVELLADAYRREKTE